jgi:hypothetical protein
MDAQPQRIPEGLLNEFMRMSARVLEKFASADTIAAVSPPERGDALSEVGQLAQSGSDILLRSLGKNWGTIDLAPGDSLALVRDVRNAASCFAIAMSKRPTETTGVILIDASRQLLVSSTTRFLSACQGK